MRTTSSPFGNKIHELACHSLLSAVVTPLVKEVPESPESPRQPMLVCKEYVYCVDLRFGFFFVRVKLVDSIGLFSFVFFCCVFRVLKRMDMSEWEYEGSVPRDRGNHLCWTLKSRETLHNRRFRVSTVGGVM